MNCNNFDKDSNDSNVEISKMLNQNRNKVTLSHRIVDLFAVHGGVRKSKTEREIPIRKLSQTSKFDFSL